MTEETETVSSTKRIAIIEASFSHPITLLFLSYSSLFLFLSISSSSSYSVALGESIHVKPCRHVGKSWCWYTRRSACRWMDAHGGVLIPPLPCSKLREVERSALHRPSRISKRVKDFPRSLHLYFRHSRTPATHQRNNISRNLPRSNET